jgi:hypothetical protein
VLYDKLIDGALFQYAEYLEARAKSDALDELLDALGSG